MNGLVAAGGSCVIAAIINIGITVAVKRAVVGICSVAVVIHLLTSIAAVIIAVSCLAAPIAVVIKTFLVILLVAVRVVFIGKAVHDCWLFLRLKKSQSFFLLSARKSVRFKTDKA